MSCPGAQRAGSIFERRCKVLALNQWRRRAQALRELQAERRGLQAQRRHVLDAIGRRWRMLDKWRAWRQWLGFVARSREEAFKARLEVRAARAREHIGGATVGDDAAGGARSCTRAAWPRHLQSDSCRPASSASSLRGERGRASGARPNATSSSACWSRRRAARSRLRCDSGSGSPPTRVKRVGAPAALPAARRAADASTPPEVRQKTIERQAKIQERFLQQWRTRSQRSAFASWVSFVQERKQLRARLAGWLFRMSHRETWAAWRQWKGFVVVQRSRESAQKHEQLAKALPRQRAAGRQPSARGSPFTSRTIGTAQRLLPSSAASARAPCRGRCSAGKSSRATRPFFRARCAVWPPVAPGAPCGTGTCRRTA
jgi:hypothetical protein